MAAHDSAAIVEAFFETLGKHDAAALRPFFADDVVYHNVPMDPCVGADASIAFLEGFFAMCDRMEVEVLNLAVSGDVVLTERVDTFFAGDVVAPLPVMGAVEVRDGKISAWRDYFDLAQVTRMFSGEA